MARIAKTFTIIAAIEMSPIMIFTSTVNFEKPRNYKIVVTIVKHENIIRAANLNCRNPQSGMEPRMQP